MNRRLLVIAGVLAALLLAVVLLRGVWPEGQPLPVAQLAYGVLALIIVAGGALARGEGLGPRWLQNLGVWIGIGAALYWLYFAARPPFAG